MSQCLLVRKSIPSDETPPVSESASRGFELRCMDLVSIKDPITIDVSTYRNCTVYTFTKIWKTTAYKVRFEKWKVSGQYGEESYVGDVTSEYIEPSQIIDGWGVNYERSVDLTLKSKKEVLDSSYVELDYTGYCDELGTYSGKERRMVEEFEDGTRIYIEEYNTTTVVESTVDVLIIENV